MADPEPRAPTIDDILSTDHRWYHVIELAPGITTPGWIDLRAHVAAADFPDDLRGKRALDVGTFDGFWAFELEKRGAHAIGIDIDDIPPKDTPAIHRQRLTEEAAGITQGTGFRLLKRYFGSSVERVSCDVMELTPERIGGPVDLAFMGAFLLHMRDPLGALERVREALNPGGHLILFEPVDDKLSKGSQPVAEFRAYRGAWTYWYPNQACLEEWARTAGFHDVRVNKGRARVRNTEGLTQELVTLHARA